MQDTCYVRQCIFFSSFLSQRGSHLFVNELWMQSKIREDLCFVVQRRGLFIVFSLRSGRVSWLLPFCEQVKSIRNERLVCCRQKKKCISRWKEILWQNNNRTWTTSQKYIQTQIDKTKTEETSWRFGSQVEEGFCCVFSWRLPLRDQCVFCVTFEQIFLSERKRKRQWYKSKDVTSRSGRSREGKESFDGNARRPRQPEQTRKWLCVYLREHTICLWMSFFATEQSNTLSRIANLLPSSLSIYHWIFHSLWRCFFGKDVCRKQELEQIYRDKDHTSLAVTRLRKRKIDRETHSHLWSCSSE